MIEYFKTEEFDLAKAQRKKALNGFYIILAIYLIISGGMLWWYLTLPYESDLIIWVKVIQYSVTAIAVVGAFVYMGIKYKRINRYYRHVKNLMTGLRETSIGSFFEYDETLQDKDGVDCKALIFIEWNKYKNDFFERKVLVFDEKEFPEFTEGQNVRYITQGNFLISYEILAEEEKTEQTEE